MGGRVVVADNCSITQSLVTNSEIGKGCRIGPFSHLRDSNVLSDEVRDRKFRRAEEFEHRSQY